MHRSQRWWRTGTASISQWTIVSQPLVCPPVIRDTDYSQEKKTFNTLAVAQTPSHSQLPLARSASSLGDTMLDSLCRLLRNSFIPKAACNNSCPPVPISGFFHFSNYRILDPSRPLPRHTTPSTHFGTSIMGFSRATRQNGAREISLLSLSFPLWKTLRIQAPQGRQFVEVLLCAAN